MACNNKITLAIVNSCTPKKGIEPTAYWGFREELQLTIVDNVITNMVAPPLGVISGSKFFMNAGHDVAVFEDQDDRFLHKFTATITENSVAVDKMDDIVLFVKANGETTWSVYGAKCGLWKTSQAQMANDNHGMTALEFASREGMEEDYSKYTTSIDIAALPNMTTFDLIYGGTMPNNGAVKLTIDAGKIGYVLLPNGQILSSNGAGVINTTYTGATGEIKYFVPKNNVGQIAISSSDLAGEITYNGNFGADYFMAISTKITGANLPNKTIIDVSSNSLLKNILAPKAVICNASGCALTKKSIGDIIYSAVLDRRENVNFNFSGGTNAIYADIYAYYLAEYGVQLNESYLDSNCPNNTILFNI